MESKAKYKRLVTISFSPHSDVVSSWVKNSCRLFQREPFSTLPVRTQPEEMPNYTIIHGNKRLHANVFNHLGYLYRVRCKIGDKAYLKCTMKNCPGTAVLHQEEDKVTPKRAHGHGTGAYPPTTSLINDLKMAAQQDLTTRSNRELFNSMTRNNPMGHQISFS